MIATDLASWEMTFIGPTCPGTYVDQVCVVVVPWKLTHVVKLLLMLDGLHPGNIIGRRLCRFDLIALALFTEIRTGLK